MRFNEWADKEARKATVRRRVREEEGKEALLTAKKAHIHRQIQEPIAHALGL